MNHQDNTQRRHTAAIICYLVEVVELSIIQMVNSFIVTIWQLTSSLSTF